MANDPGLFTDSTGEGMAGAEDVLFQTQKNMKKTYYNGTKLCNGCGVQIQPYQALYGDTCSTCKAKEASKLIKNRMVAK